MLKGKEDIIWKKWSKEVKSNREKSNIGTAIFENDQFDRATKSISHK